MDEHFRFGREIALGDGSCILLLGGGETCLGFEGN